MKRDLRGQLVWRGEGTTRTATSLSSSPSQWGPFGSQPIAISPYPSLQPITSDRRTVPTGVFYSSSIYFFLLQMTACYRWREFILNLPLAMFNALCAMCNLQVRDVNLPTDGDLCPRTRDALPDICFRVLRTGYSTLVHVCTCTETPYMDRYL